MEYDKYECNGCAYAGPNRCVLKEKARNEKPERRRRGRAPVPKRNARCRTVVVDTPFKTRDKYQDPVYRVSVVPRRQRPMEASK